MINNTLSQCEYGLVVRPYVSSTVAWTNNIVSGATGAFVNTGGWAVGTVDHNLYFGGGVGPDAHPTTLDPQFVDAASGDFRLGAGSPAIDAGDPTTTTAEAGLLDLAGNPRIAGGRVDLGALEY